MSTSHQQRRAAKQRRRSRDRSHSGDSSRSPFAPSPEGSLWDSADDDLGGRFPDDFLGDVAGDRDFLGDRDVRGAPGLVVRTPAQCGQ